LILFQFNEDYQLHGLGCTVNFLGVPQNGEYHKDVFKVMHFSSRWIILQARDDLTRFFFKTACVLPSEHIALVSAAIANAEARKTEAESAISWSVIPFSVQEHEIASRTVPTRLCYRSYSAAAPAPPKRQDPASAFAARVAPSANTQALIDAAAARDAELRARVAQADLTQQHGARIEELKALVDGFILADRQFLQLPGGTKRH
jgi:hypothetical protein